MIDNLHTDTNILYPRSTKNHHSTNKNRAITFIKNLQQKKQLTE